LWCREIRSALGTTISYLEEIQKVFVCDKIFLMLQVKRGDGLQQLVKSRLTDNMLLVETFDIRKYLLTL